MSDTSRRGFLAVTGAGVAGAGAAGAVLGAATPVAAQAPASAARDEVVVHIRDPRLAEVRLLVGEREVVVHDRDLVNRIMRAAGGQ